MAKIIKQRATLDELARGLNAAARDYAGREFRHYGGGVYRVIDVALDSETLRLVVFYESIPLVTDDSQRAPVRFTCPLRRFNALVADPKDATKRCPRFVVAAGSRRR
jgi:hypothetical protein